MFDLGKKGDGLWMFEHTENLYKIYDWEKKLTGYFFPNYNLKLNDDVEPDSIEAYEIEDKLIEKMTKGKQLVKGGNLLLPMIKLELLDINEGIDLDQVIHSLEDNARRTKQWKQWMYENQMKFDIIGSSVYTAREDRNMLSIVIGIGIKVRLGEKELRNDLNPLLNKLHQDGFI